jgi:hypothetical protein
MRRIELPLWLFFVLFGSVLALSAQNVYQALIIEKQKQTIEQYLGLEHGEHDGPVLPEPEGKPTILITPERAQKST